MAIDFDIIVDRKDTNSVKWDNLSEKYDNEDILAMWVADMDFLCPKPILDSIKKRNNHGIFGYTTRPESLHRSVIDWMKAKHGWDIKEEWLAYSPGVVTSLNIATMTFTKPGDAIIIQPPVYPPFFSAVDSHGREVVVNQLIREDGKYHMDFEDLERHMSKGAKMMILCSPHNPVGRVWTAKELYRLAKLCEKYGVFLVSDDIHSDLIYPGHHHIPIATLSDYIRDNSLTLIAPSKTFNIPGLAMSAAIIPSPSPRAKFKATINRIGIGMSNVFGITAMEAAYTHGGPWLDELNKYLEGNLSYLVKYFKRYIPEVKVNKPEGTYLVWLDFRALNMDGDTLHRYMASEGGVLLNNGKDFGSGGEGFLRLNIACPRSTLEEGLRRIDNGVKSLKKLQ